MKGKRLKEEPKNNKKIKVIVIFIIMLISIIVLVIKKKPIENEGKSVIQTTNNNIDSEKNAIEEIKISEELLKEKQFEGMKIYNISLKREDGITYFSANIENITNKKIGKQEVDVIFLDENNAQIAIFTVELDDINMGESIELPITTSMNLMSAYNFYMEK